ncbi:MAG TPA: hypothetical protein VFQ65_01600, partial [Kofleriaceae bacterium]|nr:hypothetical protein [Kofleriaceae bacterium]
WLIAREADSDSIVGEIAAEATHRTLSLRAGRYLVRGRTRDALLEGRVTVSRGRETVVAAADLTSTRYARLVRKGRGEIVGGALGWFAGPAVASAIIEGATPCIGGTAGAMWATADVTWSPRVVGCRGTFSNQTLSARTDLLALDLRVAKAWDISRITVDLGVTAGGELLQERFTTRGIAPTRTSAAGHIDAGIGVLVPIHGPFYAASELGVQTHFLSIEDQMGDSRVGGRFAVRGMLVLGAWY